MSRPRRLRFAAVAWCCAVALAAGLVLRVAWVAFGPLDEPGALHRQTSWLIRQKDAPAAMQQLFPEGALFQHVLTALAVARDEQRPANERLAVVREAMDALAQPTISSPFAGCAELDRGIFYEGWLLHLRVAAATLGDQEALAAARSSAQRILQAVAANPFPESYRGGRWPVDTVVALGAVASLDRLDPVAGLPAALDAWRTRSASGLDPATGLLAHRVGADDAPLEGARGSSQSLIQVFWPLVDPAGAPASWRAFLRSFAVTTAGLVGIREYPVGVEAQGDVDSGPLILGVSLSSSAVAVAAARAHGDLAMAEGLLREAELLGLPLELPDGRRYAFGLLPVGDAFLAWSRFQPAASAASGGPTPPFGGWLGAAPVPLLLLLGGRFLLRRARRRPGVG